MLTFMHMRLLELARALASTLLAGCSASSQRLHGGGTGGTGGTPTFSIGPELTHTIVSSS